MHEAEAVDDPKRRKPDISRAKSALGWEPKVQLREGLNLTIAAFRQSLRNENGYRRLSAAEKMGMRKT